MKLLDKVALGALGVVVVMLIVAILAQLVWLVKVTIGVLVVVSLGYTIGQILGYFNCLDKTNDPERKGQFVVMIVSVAVTLVVAVIAIFVLTGKLALA